MMDMKEYDGGTNKELTEVARQRCLGAFVDSYEPTEEEGLGLAIASHFSWDGTAILRAFFAALEDANFHPEAAKVQEWLEGSS